MTNIELANRLTSELKAYLKASGHVDSGALYNSIKFTVSENPFDIKLDAEKYIEYLDDGKFLDKFFAQEKITNLFVDYFNSKISLLI
jgi:hypothetical protein